MDYTGNGDREVKKAVNQDMVANSTPYPKSERKSIEKTRRAGRPAKTQSPPTRDEALSLLASALAYCVDAGIEIGAKNIDTGTLLVMSGISCSTDNGNLAFSSTITVISEFTATELP